MGSLKDRFPLTPLGTLLVLASLGLFSFSILTRDNLMLLMAFTGVLLPFILRLIGQFISSAEEKELYQWRQTSQLWSLQSGVLLTHSGSSAPLLFRRHLHLRGTLQTENAQLYRFHLDLGLSKEGGELPLLPPASGLLKLEATQSLQDVLGLSRKKLPGKRILEIPVCPAGSNLDQSLPLFHSETETDQAKKRRPDQEKVFTREYTPGDLARDINWKSVARIGKLITRIPPESFGVSPRLELYFRSPPARFGRASLQFLEMEKTLLVSFMRNLWKADENRSFKVFLNRNDFLLQSEDDLEGFLRELALTGFSTSYNDYPLPEKGCCIFSSCLDDGLKTALTKVDKTELHLFMGQPASVEHPGTAYPFCEDWPRFLPKRNWINRRKPAPLTLPAGMPFYYAFYLEGLK